MSRVVNNIGSYYDKQLLKRLKLTDTHCVVCRKHRMEHSGKEGHPVCLNNLELLEWRYEESEKRKTLQKLSAAS